MAVRYYDEALIEKIKRWVIDPKMKILGPSEARELFRQNSDRDFDKAMTLPLIVLSRDNYCEINNSNKQALSYDGGHIDIVNEKRSGVLNAIPIKLTYELSIYTRYFEEADEYARNFIFNLINYPTLDINIPYQNANIAHRSKIYLDNTSEGGINGIVIYLDNRVIDNSGNSGRLARDQYSKISLTLEINDAYLFSIPILYNWDIVEETQIGFEEDK